MHLPEDFEQAGQGEKFVYRGHACKITYDGTAPTFLVDGEDAAAVLRTFDSAEDVGIGVMDWRDALVRAIDAEEGDDTDAPDYLLLEERRILRQHALQLITDLAEATGSYGEAFNVVEETGGDWWEIHARFEDTDLHHNLGDVEKLGATDATRARFTREVAEVLDEKLEYTSNSAEADIRVPAVGN